MAMIMLEKLLIIKLNTMSRLCINWTFDHSKIMSIMSGKGTVSSNLIIQAFRAKAI